MKTMNATRDAGTGTGTVWDIRGTTGTAGHVPAARNHTAAYTFTSATWGDALAASAIRERPTAARAPAASFLGRVMKRKMAQWTAAYLGGAWAVIQLIDVLAGTWAVPALIQQLAFLVLGLGIMPTLVVAWYHGEKGRQEVCPTECTLIAASIMASVAAVWMFCLGRIA